MSSRASAARTPESEGIQPRPSVRVSTPSGRLNRSMMTCFPVSRTVASSRTQQGAVSSGVMASRGSRRASRRVLQRDTWSNTSKYRSRRSTGSVFRSPKPYSSMTLVGVISARDEMDRRSLIPRSSSERRPGIRSTGMHSSVCTHRLAPGLVVSIRQVASATHPEAHRRVEIESAARFPSCAPAR